MKRRGNRRMEEGGGGGGRGNYRNGVREVEEGQKKNVMKEERKGGQKGGYTGEEK